MSLLLSMVGELLDEERKQDQAEFNDYEMTLRQRRSL